MRCLYREKRYHCGNYLDVEVYPVFSYQKRRGAKKNPTSETQKKLNQKRAELSAIRTINANFTGKDFEIELTYTDETRPATLDDALRDRANFIRRLKRLYRKWGIRVIKLFLVTEEAPRYHHHIVVTGCDDRDALEALWQYGYANSKRLRFNENGVEGLARYITKESHRGDKNAFRRRFSVSRNMEKPKESKRDGRISARKAEELATYDAMTRREWEKLYPGYVFVKSEPLFNEVNGEYYILARLYKAGTKFGITEGGGKRRVKKT